MNSYSDVSFIQIFDLQNTGNTDMIYSCSTAYFGNCAHTYCMRNSGRLVLKPNYRITIYLISDQLDIL